MPAPAPRSMLAILRSLMDAARLHCPNCRSRWPRTRWISLDPRCESCGIRVDRGESDYFLGSYTINLFVALVAAAAIAVAAVWLPGRGLLIYGLVLPILTALTIGFYPVSRLVWLAVDLILRPARPSDFAEPSTESR